MPREEYKKMSLPELKRRLEERMDEIYALRMEISRREGDVPEARGVDFEKYITE